MRTLGWMLVLKRKIKQGNANYALIEDTSVEIG